MFILKRIQHAVAASGDAGIFKKKIFTAIVILSCFSIHLLYGQVQSNAPWPMFMQNPCHTGQTNNNVAGPNSLNLKWVYTADAPIYSTPAIGPDGAVYFGTVFPDWMHGSVIAVTNGFQKWIYSSPTNIFDFSSPAIGSDGKIYIGANNMIHNTGFLYAITNGNIKWLFRTNAFIYSSPTIGSNSTVYVGCQNGCLYAITNGIKKWTFNSGSAFFYGAAAIGTNKTVFIGNDNGNFYAITNGKQKWVYSVGGGNVIRFSPLIGPDNTIYFSEWWNSYMYAVKNGVFQWRFQADSQIFTSPCMDQSGTIYFASGQTLYAVTNGYEKWHYTAPAASFNQSSPVVSSNGNVYISLNNGTVIIVNNGVLVSSYTTGGNINTSSPVLDQNGVLYIGCENGSLYALRGSNPPLLSWTGNPGFISDGVEPNTNVAGARCQFEIKYSDPDNDPPSLHQLWLDVNDDGLYDGSEKFSMASNSGSSYLTGIIFTNSVTLYYCGDGKLNYKFFFQDVLNVPVRTNACSSNHFVNVTNGKILKLSWTGEPGYLDRGVNPLTNYRGGTFIFRVRYTNADNMRPVTNQVWIDTNDNGIYENKEKFSMNEVNALDNNVTDGKDYTFTNIIVYAGDGVLNYKFCFWVTNSTASGDPSTVHAFTIIPTRQYFVKTNGNNSLSGKCWELAWKTIGYGVTNIVAGDILVVSNGIYPEQIIPPINGAAERNGTNFNIRLKSFDYGEAVIDGSGFPCCILLQDRHHIIVEGFSLKKATYGISFGVNDSSQNIITNNVIYSNSFSGIYASGPGGANVTKNKILHNQIFGPGQQYGVYFNNGYNNLISGSNRIHNNTQIGICFLNAVDSSIISCNLIYSNNARGVHLSAPLGTSLPILNNVIFGPNQATGILISDYDRVNVQNNKIFKHDGTGVAVTAWAYYDTIYNNEIYSNGTWGVTVGGGSEGIPVSGNRISHNRTGGISISGGSHTIANNTVCSNTEFGIFLSSASGALYNNDVYGPCQLIGIQNSGWGGAGYSIYNNRVFKNDSTGLVEGPGIYSGNIVRKNDIYSNKTNGILITGFFYNYYYISNTIHGSDQESGISDYAGGSNVQFVGNNVYNNDKYGFYFQDPLVTIGNMRMDSNQIYSNRLCGILSQSSFSNNLIFSNQICGPSQEIGICFKTNSCRNSIIGNTIRECASNGIAMTGGATANLIKKNRFFGPGQKNGLLISQGKENEVTNNFFICNNYGIVLDQRSVNNLIVSNKVISNTSAGIYLVFSSNNRIKKNRVTGPNQDIGIYFSGAYNNKVTNNFISRNNYGLYFDQGAGNNGIFSNRSCSNTSAGVYISISSNNNFQKNSIFGPGQVRGVHFYQASRNSMTNNNIFLNTSSGLYFGAGTAKNSIFNNNIYSNTGTGVYFNEDKNRSNRIFANTIYGPSQICGIYLGNSDANILGHNRIFYNSQNGITLTNNLGSFSKYNCIVSNSLFRNLGHGMFLSGSNNIVSYNDIYSNSGSGLEIRNSMFNTNCFNLMYKNNYGIYIENSTCSNTLIRNCDFFMNNNDGFRDQNVAPRGILIRNCISTSNLGYGFNNFSSLTYSDAFGNALGNYSQLPGIGSKTNDPFFIVTTFGDPNFLRLFQDPLSPCINKGDPTDPVPAGGGSRIDMGMYEFIFGAANFTLLKDGYPQLHGLSSPSIPGAMIQYTIHWSNSGSYIADQVIVYDQLPKNIGFFSNSFICSNIPWIAEYSTNLNPDQTWNSVDYTSGSYNNSKLRWIRFKNPLLGINSACNIHYNVYIK